MAGVDVPALTELAIQWGQRASATPPSLTTRDIDILAALDEWKFLTTRMIARLFWGDGHVYAVQRRLKRLHDAGYVDRFRPRHAPGAQEWIYRIARPGWEALVAAGRVTEDRLPNRELTYLGYVEHDLQLVAILLDVADRSAPGTDALYSRMPFDWLGVERGRIRPDETSEISIPGDSTVDLGDSRQGVVEPDATLIGRHATTGEQVAVLIEYDRTRRPAKQRDRFRRYDWLMTVGWRQSRLAACAYEPALVFIVQRKAQLAAFVREADRQLTASLRPADATAPDRMYPGREQIAFTSRDRLAAGDWTMTQVPALPRQARRAAGHSASPRTLDLPLDRYFQPRSARP